MHMAQSHACWVRRMEHRTPCNAAVNADLSGLYTDMQVASVYHAHMHVCTHASLPSIPSMLSVRRHPAKAQNAVVL